MAERDEQAQLAQPQRRLGSRLFELVQGLLGLIQKLRPDPRALSAEGVACGWIPRALDQLVQEV